MKIIGIIQARMSSTRLPAKVLFDLEGKTVLEHVASRIARVNRIAHVLIATTIRREDLAIVKLAAGLGFNVFCGSENDVLDRFYQAAKLYDPDHVVRVTADCPLMDPEVVNQVIQLHIDSGSDYTSNVLEETFPDGEDIEVFTFNSLKEAWQNAILVSEREHVTPYIRKRPESFKLTNLRAPKDLSGKRWTLDNPDDYEFLKRVYGELYAKNPFFGMNDVLALLDWHPEYEKINQHIRRNEGYQKSLKKDKAIEK